MKTRTWIVCVALFCILCAAAAALLPYCYSGGGTAQVYSDGILVMTLDLSEDGDYLISGENGTNLLRVSNGKLAVVDASCGNGDCIRHAPASSGTPIVCLPNRLVIRFTAPAVLDAIAG